MYLRWLVAVLAASLCVATSACSATNAAPPRHAPVAIPAPAVGSLLREPTAEEADLLYRAEQLRLRDCMKRQGFDYFLVPRSPVPELRDFPYIVDDVAWAKRYGYGSVLQRRSEEALQNDPNERYFASLPPQQKAQARLARNGDANTGDLLVDVPGIQGTVSSSKGCRAAAQRELYGDLPTWVRAQTVSDALVLMRRGAVTSDARFTAAVKRWSRCMHELGHAYATPTEARDSVARQAAEPGPQVPGTDGTPAAETALAVAEATCAGRTDLAATARQLDRDHDDLLRERYQADAAARQRLQLEALTRARAIVAAG